MFWDVPILNTDVEGGGGGAKVSEHSVKTVIIHFKHITDDDRVY